jgi:hypothetical protein
MAKQRNSAIPAASAPRWHRDALRISSELTQRFRRKYQPDAIMVTPEAVIELLTKARVKFVLMGTYGIEVYRSEPRATQDVDVIVRKADHAKAVKAVHQRFPTLAIQDTGVVTRFTDPETELVVLDLMKPEQPPYETVFRNTVTAEEGHLIPNLEMALVSKYAAMVSRSRAYDKKLIDAGDFVSMVKSNLRTMNRARLRRLAETIYKGGGAEVLQMIDDIAAGRPIKF